MIVLVCVLRIAWLATRITLHLAFRLTITVFNLIKWGGLAPVGALGSARFANRWELFWSGVRRGNGPIVGRKGRSFLRFNKDGMITVFAPMGAGKGVGIVIPNLLEYPGSVVCTDIKGENFAITRRHRATFGEVRALDTTDPFRCDRFNPLDMIRVGTFHEKDDASALARLMVIPDGKESHWDSKAEGMLTCLILYVVHLPPELQALSHLRSLSTLPPESLKELLHTIARDGTRAAAELAGSFLSMEGSEEFRSVLSNTEKATRVWSHGGPAAEISSCSTFQLHDLVDRTLTLFIIVDEEKLGIYAPFLRVMVGCVLNTLTRAKARPRPRHKVLLLLDEVAALGSLEPLERGVGYLRAYCTPLLIFQDMSQLRDLYRRSGSFLANAACKVFFNIADLDAARFVSEIIGQTTSVTRNQGTSRSSLDMLPTQHSLGVSETARWLLDPSEVLRLPGSRSIVLYRSDLLRYPVLAAKINYRSWWRWRWWGKYDAWRPSEAAAGPAPASFQDRQVATAACGSSRSCNA